LVYCRQSDSRKIRAATPITLALLPSLRRNPRRKSRKREAYWDIQNKHSTFFSDPALDRPFYVNEQAPKEYNNVAKYTSPGGLNEIMK